MWCTKYDNTVHWSSAHTVHVIVFVIIPTFYQRRQFFVHCAVNRTSLCLKCSLVIRCFWFLSACQQQYEDLCRVWGVNVRIAPPPPGHPICELTNMTTCRQCLRIRIFTLFQNSNKHVFYVFLKWRKKCRKRYRSFRMITLLTFQNTNKKVSMYSTLCALKQQTITYSTYIIV